MKIADYGLARAVGNEEMTITFAGSPALLGQEVVFIYSMAPELIGQNKVTNTIDVYSFGCVVDEIITEKTCYFDYHVTTQQKVLFFECPYS